MSQAHLQLGGLQELAINIEHGLQAMNPLDWVQYFILIGILGLILILVIVLFPSLLKCLFNSLKAVQQDIFQIQFKNKKGGTATPTAVTPV